MSAATKRALVYFGVLVAIELALLGVIGVSAAAGPPHRAGVTCPQVGFTIAGTTTFGNVGGWTELLLQNRLQAPNLVTVQYGAVQYVTLAQPDTLVRIPLRHSPPSFTVEAQRSGTAIYACT